MSAWFYRCHSPNNDCFQVRPYFKDIYRGKLPKVDFKEYIEMNEYQNIQTRMLGADSFPYRNISIDASVLALAKEAIDRIYFVGIQEEYDVSIQLLLRMMQFNGTVNVQKERDQLNREITKKKKLLLNDQPLMMKVKQLNSYDVELYRYGKAIFSFQLTFFFLIFVYRCGKILFYVTLIP